MKLKEKLDITKIKNIKKIFPKHSSIIDDYLVNL